MNADPTCATCPWSHADGTECRLYPPQAMEGRDGNGNPVTFTGGRGTSPNYWCSAHPGRQPVKPAWRDQLAAMAMEGVEAANFDGIDQQQQCVAWVVERAYAVADAMLTEAAKRKED